MTLTTTISNDVAAKLNVIAERSDVKKAEVARAMILHFTDMPEKEQDAAIFKTVKAMKVMALKMRREALASEMKKIAIEIGAYDKVIDG